MKLLSPTKLGQLELCNSVVFPPMCTFMANPDTNEPDDKHLVHYGAIAFGGCGLIIVEATPVNYNGRNQPDDVGLWDDNFIPAFKRINDFIHKNTPTKTAIQLAHAGRKGPATAMFSRDNRQLEADEPYGCQRVSSSAVAYDDKHPVPHALSKEEMMALKDDFVAATRRAIAAGFDAIALQNAHGRLLNQFTSPLVNERTDEYGGSFENRIRYSLEIIRAMKSVMPSNMPLIVRISADDWCEGGWNVQDSIEFTKRMKTLGVDAVDVEAGGVSPKQKIPGFAAAQIALAAEIHKAVPDIRVMAVGQVVDMETANDILESGKADFVAVGRAQMRNPYWVRNEASRLGVTIWHPKYQAPAYYSARKQTAAPGVKSN